MSEKEQWEIWYQVRRKVLSQVLKPVRGNTWDQMRPRRRQWASDEVQECIKSQLLEDLE